ncbi:MAG: hypothetical protein LQ342_000389 [Letrouitia transgressa]|nr:MAG: hypothetical protein LQ342_000389 [Letrouitia transgressa]
MYEILDESDDDLDIIRSVRRDPGIKDNASVVRSASESEANLKESNVPLRAPQRRHAINNGEKDLWSDEDSEGAYVKFKSRKTFERKRAAASSRKARAIEKANANRKRSRKDDDVLKDNGPAKKKSRGTITADEDDLMEYTLPDYLQERRARFEKRMDRLKESGLKLPPTYDDIEFSDDERLGDLRERPDFPLTNPSAKYKDIQLPKSLGLIPAPTAQWLRDYQVEGASFLHQLFVYQVGGILGDDMGLGKTVQVIAFLTAAFGKTGDERDAKRMRKMRRAGVAWYPRVLVVCPGTLIQNWKAELGRWGWWHVDVFHADSKEAAIKAATSGRTEIMFTTYSTYRTNKDEINMIEWDCVIADECHQIKGRHSETTQALNEVNALCRIGLTGTAIQNSYDELWTLLNWTNPGKFGPITDWRASISDPLKLGQSHDATVYQLSKARKTARALVENLLPQFFLRRMKTIIADQLPKKSDRVVFCPLTATQADAYENCLDSDVMHYIKTSTDMCACGSGKKSGWCCNDVLPDGSKWRSHVFPSIINLQKLSNHLAMLIPQSTDPKDRQDKDLEMLQVAVPDQWRHLYRNRDSILNYSNPEFCGKWKILRKLLKFWHANGDKVLVFSHSVRLLKMLQMLFNHTSYSVSYLDGAMSYEDRAKTVDDFNSDPGQFVFLISTKAGGVGLNITSANKVVVVDPNWNPAYDLQAQDRAYRIGQVRDVEVFRLVSAGTIEEIVYARQIYKQQQANIGYTASKERRYFKGVQEKKEQKGEIFGLANLFAYQGDNIVLRDIVNKTNVAESKAGVAVVGLDLDDEDVPDGGSDEADDPLFGGGGGGGGTGSEDEDSAIMSQLAALIGNEAAAVDDPASVVTAGNNNNNNNNNDDSGKRKISETGNKKTKKKKKGSDPVQAILAGAGVEYTHENSEVVGSSKIEAGLSRRALEAGPDLDIGEQHVFAGTQEQQRRRRRRGGGANSDEEGEEEMEWRYGPPQEVMKRQLCTMARTFGFADVVEFALLVEGWTQDERTRCLERFYRGRREKLGMLER